MDQGQLRWADGAALTLALSPRVLRAATGGAAHGPWGRRKGRNDEERTKRAQVNQTKSDQIKPNPTKSNQIIPDQDGSRAILDPGAGGWIKTGAAELRFGSSALDAGSAERMNGKTKGLSDRNTFFICFTDERGSVLEENLRLCSPMFA